jgi:SAM-dependent methyltransferase
VSDEPYREELDPRLTAVAVVAFDGDGVLGRAPVAAKVLPGEHWVLAASRAVRSAGGSLASLHPFLVRGGEVVAWAELRTTGVPVGSLDGAGPLAALAAVERERLSDQAWFRDVRRLLEAHYLAADDPYAQSGKSGGAASWEQGRRFIAGACHRSGTFLDVGCANGQLMESMVGWALADRGVRIEPYGLDISPGLAALARRRLPAWADRIWVGNAWDWEPPRRFDVVHAMPDVVPDHLRRPWLDRMVARFLLPGGRLVLHANDPYPEDVDRRTLPDLLSEAGVRASGELVRERPGKPAVRAAWLDAPA